MKKLILILMILTINAQAFTKKDKEQVLELAIVSAITSYGPAFGDVFATATGLMFSELITKEVKAHQAMKKIVLNDIEEYFYNGNMSINLKSTVQLIRENDPTISANEAIDAISESLNNF